MENLIEFLDIIIFLPWIFFYWYCAYRICRKLNIVNSFGEFLITKRLESDKLIWGIIFNKDEQIQFLNKDLKFYIVKYGVWIFILTIFLYRFFYST
ncbi:hypothetical protein AKG09_11270 [Neisseria sp. 83E34]|nr:hypothetical protein AKG09_11270 [Neisseria sp. 83E34]